MPPRPPVDGMTARGDLTTEPAAVILPILMRRIGVEAGPLGVFFIAFYLWGIVTATAVFILATLVAVAASLRAERCVPVLPLVSLGFVLGFGALTIAFQDPRFIMIRPTAICLVYGAALVMSAAANRPLLEILLSPGLLLDREGWLKLTRRAGLFLLAQALLNEVVWRGLGVDAWMIFRTFGSPPLNLLFILAQAPLFRVHRLGGQILASAPA